VVNPAQLEVAVLAVEEEEEGSTEDDLESSSDESPIKRDTRPDSLSIEGPVTLTGASARAVDLSTTGRSDDFHYTPSALASLLLLHLAPEPKSGKKWMPVSGL